MKKIASIFVLVLICISPIYAIADDGGWEKGQYLPDIAFTNADNEEVSLHRLRGSIVVVNFWATWCGPCVSELQDFQHVYEMYKENDDVQLVLLNMFETYAEEVAFIERNNYTVPLSNSNYEVRDLTDTAKKVLTDSSGNYIDFGLDSIPYTFVLNRSGQTMRRFQNDLNAINLVRIIEALRNG